MAPLFLVALVLVVLVPDLPLKTTLDRAEPPLPAASAVAASADVSPTTRS